MCVKAHSLEIDLDQTISEVQTSAVIVFHQGEKGMFILVKHWNKPAIRTVPCVCVC